MYVYSYDYIKPKYGEKVELCYINMDSFIVPIKSDDVYADITEHIEKIVDASKYKDDRPLQIGKSLKLLKDGLDGKKNGKNFYPYDLRCIAISHMMIMLTRKKSGTEKCFIKLEIKFQRMSEEN